MSMFYFRLCQKPPVSSPLQSPVPCICPCPRWFPNTRRCITLIAYSSIMRRSMGMDWLEVKRCRPKAGAQACFIGFTHRAHVVTNEGR